PTKSPQTAIDDFWEGFNTKYPGEVVTVLPSKFHARRVAENVPRGAVLAESATTSFEEAKAICKAKVEKIARECRRVNQKYRDPHFDIEFDFKRGRRYCLDGLVKDCLNLSPKSVKRVEDIFENPQFYINGPTASDVRQGGNGDCWFLAALCTLSNKEELLSNICVARDEQVGVYGFVFHRDGEWISEIIDDKLYLTKVDYDAMSEQERYNWSEINRADTEEEWKKTYQSGSAALYFAQCSEQNETWLPLLEKAYAKAHGDFGAIEGGFVGEAIEDLTGGVTTELFTSDILDKNKFWKEELMNVNKTFLFGCATGYFGEWAFKRGIVATHAYSIMQAREVKGHRLLLLRNPWGETEWNGAWSDGSAEWTPEMMTELGHSFGNDGVFWISYEDLLRKYQQLDRTRLFGPGWNVARQWTSLEIPWTVGYHDTKFRVTLEKDSQAVIVLTQLDSRYWRGLEGQYRFTLQFRLHKEGEEDYIVRSHGNYNMTRSVSTELELEAGSYLVLLKIIATRYSNASTAEHVLKTTCKDKRDKLLQIGLSYDLAHAKGQTKETEKEKEEREKREKLKKKLEKKRKLEQKRKAKAEGKELKRKEKAKAKKKEAKAKAKEAKKQEKAQRKLAKAAKKATNDGLRASGKGAEQASTSSHTSGDAILTPPDVAEQQAHEMEKPSSSSAHSTTVAEEKKDGDAKSPANADSDSESESDDNSSESSDESESEAPATASDASKPEENPSEKNGDDKAEDDEDDDFKKDPWNAVSVVGLRVFTKDSNATVEIVRPPPEDEIINALDLDDAAVDAT
ncbi:cysteine proteinase, partial [Xylona heveae TC161]